MGCHSIPIRCHASLPVGLFSPSKSSFARKLWVLLAPEFAWSGASAKTSGGDVVRAGSRWKVENQADPPSKPWDALTFGYGISVAGVCFRSYSAQLDALAVRHCTVMQTPPTHSIQPYTSDQTLDHILLEGSLARPLPAFV